MREIEVKYQVEDMEALLVALKSRGIELSEPVFQDDQAYAPAGWQFGDSKLGVSFLRLRTVAGRHYFTFKQPADSAQACLEYETQVTDRQACTTRPCTWATARPSGSQKPAAWPPWMTARCASTTLRASADSSNLSTWHPTTPIPTPCRLA